MVAQGCMVKTHGSYGEGIPDVNGGCVNGRFGSMGGWYVVIIGLMSGIVAFSSIVIFVLRVCEMVD
jgi:hypothetical protein